MMAPQATELDAALGKFHVGLISTFEPDLVWAPADVEAAPWLAKNNLDFDQFPVRGVDGTVGILFRADDCRDRTVREAMRPLQDGRIVSAHMPIADLIPQLRENHCRLVLRGTRIDGLVTQSDLLKLPVRMLLFGLVSHLELRLRELIRRRVPWPAWLDLLESKRRNAVKLELKKLKEARLEPDPLEFTSFGDAVRVLADQPDLPGFRDEMAAIKEFRDSVAHAKTYIGSAEDVRLFVDSFTSIRTWIDRVSSRMG